MMASRNFLTVTMYPLRQGWMKTRITLLSFERSRRTPAAGIATFRVPPVKNEPNHHYEKSSEQRSSLENSIAQFQARMPLAIPLAAAGKEIKTNIIGHQYNPADHSSVVATYSKASAEDMPKYIASAMNIKPWWESLSFSARASVFLKAADLVSTKYRYEIMAATMLGQGKNAWQAEIDSAAELADFFRFNVKYAEQLYATQPQHHSPGVWNRTEYRALEGFVYAISPFNFTAIAGNLIGAPALLGNVVIWKPSDSAIASNWLVYKILVEAGLPPEVIQFVPGDAVEITRAALESRHFSALHFTGSTFVFRQLWKQIGTGVAENKYTNFPRVVGETGGKNFHLIHPTADIRNAVVHTVRGAFEFSGQKCSATSRCYVPESIWPQFRNMLIAEVEKLKVGDPTQADTFVGPVIHRESFNKLKKVIVSAKNDADLKLLCGGKYDDSKGYFIHPTVYEVSSPTHYILKTEFFGPVLGVYVYSDSGTEYWSKICQEVGQSEYALTGSVFGTDIKDVDYANNYLRHHAGNFYVNCKSTGAVVGQQPFGGARASGTNDKAGSASLMGRFVSPRDRKSVV